MGKKTAFLIKSVMNCISRSKLSVIGAILLSVLTPVLLVSVLVDIKGTVENPYFGFFIYLILGPLFLIAIILLAIGLFLCQGKEDIGLFAFEYLAEEFARPGRHSRIRRHLLLTLLITLSTIILVATVSYTGYHYTESTAFCAQSCHQVMEPAYETYRNSPHSRIPCVECHIGKHAQWLTKAKFSGFRQIFAVLFDSYPRPIPQPITALRPVRATCEECHRPEMFHGDKLYMKDRFLPDEHNTHVQTALLMKIGSGGYQGRTAHGIHWHVSEEHQVYYRSTDPAQENIIEVWMQDKGKEIHFYKKGGDATEASTRASSVRQMDCMDCHNRPTHIFRSAGGALDEKMAAGAIPAEIPFIKKEALELITRPYRSEELAMQSISRGLKEWYGSNYPELVATKKPMLEQAIAGVQQAYGENVFPEMNIKWDTYKNFIGHKNGTGCFRCHDGRHFTQSGQAISQDCNLCHVILAENEPAPEVLHLLKRSLTDQPH